MKTPLKAGLKTVGTSSTMSRRRVLESAGAAAAASLVALPGGAGAVEAEGLYRVRHGRIKQSVVPWCFNPMPPAELVGHAVRLGLPSVELIGSEHWPLLKKHGLVCALTSSHGFAQGFAHVEEHEHCLAVLTERIEATAAAGFPSVITFSGFRRGISDEEGMRNMVVGLKKIARLAEQRKVTLCLEMLNSRVAVAMKGHPDYFCDDIDRTVEICRRVSSERVKVLFDIYHVQIMHGDVITRLKQHREWTAHYHTAGVPGRQEIDDTQELNYAAIMRAIVDTGYQGYVGQEFIPARDKVLSLSQAVKTCDV